MSWWRPGPRFINYQVVGKRLVLRAAFFQGEIWLTQKQLARIFNLRVPTVNEHLKKILGEPGYPPAKLVRQFKIKVADGKKYLVNHYRHEVMEAIKHRVRQH
jgi:hypothetical protein